MVTLQIIYGFLILSMVLNGILTSLFCRALKRADLWEPEKAFGIETGLGLPRSIRNYRQKRQLVEPQARKNMDFYLYSHFVLAALTIILFILSLFWIPMK